MSILPEPQGGMIVSCKFPEENTIIPGPKLRPVLILETYEDRNEILVVYGTGQNTSATPGSPELKPYEIEIDPSDIYGKISNLGNITRFNFRKTIPIPYTEKWFQPYPGKHTIVIGHAHNTYNESIINAYEESRKNLAKCQNFVERKPPIIKYVKKKK